MSKADEFFKAMEEKSGMNADMQKAVMDKLYKGTVAKRLVTVEGDFPVILKKRNLNYKFIVLTALVLIALTFLTGCSSKHATLESTSNQPSEIIAKTEVSSQLTQSPVMDKATPEKVNQVTVRNVSEGSNPSTKATSPAKVIKPKTIIIEKKSTRPVLTNTEVKDSKVSNAELATKNPPAIGATAPWYMPTIDTIAKAYTSTKPYMMGNNYALVNEGDYILYIYLTDSNTDSAYWTGRKIFNLEPANIKVYENVMLNIGKGNIVTAKYAEETEWRAIYSNETIDTKNLPYTIKNQTWGKIREVK